MTLARRAAGYGLVFLLVSCGGEQKPRISAGLKIFVSARTHVADFANDPYLSGSNAIEKADDFCNTDSNRLDTATYRAMIVDAVVRDAKTRTNWVLQPSTTYYQSYSDVVIGATTANAIFGAFYAPLTNPIDPASAKQVWTGIGSAADFAAGANCARWSDATNTYHAGRGVSDATDGNAFSAIGDMGCAFFQLNVYCVQQP